VNPTTEHLFAMLRLVADLPSPELVENRRRSIAMLPVGAPALNREEALEVLRQLVEALRRLRAFERGDEECSERTREPRELNPRGSHENSRLRSVMRRVRLVVKPGRERRETPVLASVSRLP
jgi:hypothetical protein